MRVCERGQGFVRFETVSHKSKLTQWIRWDSSEIRWFSVDATHTQVVWRIRFERQLDPVDALAPRVLEDAGVVHEHVHGVAALVDAFRENHPDVRRYTWFNVRAERWGRLDAARVDYALVARALMPRVLETEVLDHRFGSDHAPIRARMSLVDAARG